MRGALIFCILVLMQSNVLSIDLGGKTLILTGEGQYPHYIAHGPRPRGVLIDIANILAEKHGFDYTFYEAPFGSVLVDGKWKGAIGEILKGDADVALGFYSFSYQRTAAVDFLIPLLFPKILLIARQPRPMPQITNVTKPFTLPGWILFLVAIIGAGLMHILAVKATPAVIDTLRISPMYIICILFEQGTTLRVRPLSGLIFTLALLLFTTWMWQAFDCNLRSYLISVDHEKPIDTMADILELGWNFYIPDGTALGQYLATSQIKEYRQVYTIAKQKGHFLGLSKGRPYPLRKFLEEDMVSVISKVLMNSFLKRAERVVGPNAIRPGKPLSLFLYSSMAVRKNSSLKAPLDETLTSIVETGILAKLHRNYQLWVDLSPPEDKDIPLNMDHILLPLLMLGLGLMLALIQFLRERIDGAGFVNAMKNILRSPMS